MPLEAAVGLESVYSTASEPQADIGHRRLGRFQFKRIPELTKLNVG